MPLMPAIMLMIGRLNGAPRLLAGPLLACLAGLILVAGSNNARAGMSDLPEPLFDRNCSDTRQQVALFEAQVRVERFINEAIRAVDYLKNSQEYKDTFGAYDSVRHQKVKRRLQLIKAGFQKTRIVAKCEPAGQSRTCNNGAWAYITKQKFDSKTPYIINFCPSFFSATRETVRKISEWSEVDTMRGAVLLHELTHFAWPIDLIRRNQPGTLQRRSEDSRSLWVSGAKDEEYDAEGVKYLADTDPESAIANADSYHIFMMRLSTRNRSKFR